MSAPYPGFLRDSTTAADIPSPGLVAVAGYGDGVYEWSSADWARFPPPIVPLSIVVSALDAGDVLDVETGDAAPADAPAWADRFDRPGRRAPTIYCSRAAIGAVREAMGPRPFDWWAATLDGTTSVSGAVAVQYCGAVDSNDPCRTSGHYDESVIWDPGWLGLTAPVDPPQPQEDAMLTIFTRPDGTEDTFELFPQGVGPYPPGTILWTWTELAQFVVRGRAVVPGTWVSIERVGLWTSPATQQTELFLRGTGTDGALWQASLQLVPGASWVEETGPISA